MNVYDVINQRIMELLEQNVIPWKKPWNAQSSYPKNIISGKKYQGVNVFMLACSEFSSPYWMTFKQCQDKGGHVIKGSKSTPVIFWKWLDRKDAPTEGDNSTNGKIPMLRFYSVFNIEQTEGITPPPAEETHNIFDPVTRAEEIIAAMPMKPDIRFGGGRAYYSPTLDYVQLSHQHTFDTIEHYYNTLFHELSHATGHANRLGRKGVIETSYFGSHEYSKEELVAEMGAAFLCGHAGIENTTLENSAAYIQGWLKALKNDKTLLVQAAGQAQKASDYILNVKPDAQEDAA
ncbi:MAG: zincin-like metallopeptidase domain-containing protein [Candidatus Cloacimonetes bacterium]|nr:zincin-like metallopeptidase domain-containing protein [Candidatus Cloacimonadota bacterium]